MDKIRVLVVDDAVVVRLLVTKVLSGDPDIEVVSTAANGRIALSKIAQLKPDLVTMDVEMPELNGLETLAELRKSYPRLPVIMFSTLTERGGQATLEALSLGANDYVTKPANVGSVTEGIDRIRDDLIPKVKHWCGRSTPVVPPPSKAPEASKTTKAPRGDALTPPPRAATDKAPKRVDLVAIGVSTGGPNALADLLSLLPGTLPVPVVIVQHMPATFTRLLAERLDSRCALTVREATQDAAPKPGEVWIAPGDYHMRVVKGAQGFTLKLSQEPPENFCRPAVDVLFRSVATACGANSLALVLTGMGHDGFAGSQAIYAAGGRILAQDEPSSVVWGMPSFIVKGGLSDATLPLNLLAQEITRRVALERPRLQTV